MGFFIVTVAVVDLTLVGEAEAKGAVVSADGSDVPAVGVGAADTAVLTGLSKLIFMIWIPASSAYLLISLIIWSW